jgi:hypothetical protein
MPVEAATYISDFSPTLPGVSDLESEGDDHLRLIKLVLQSTFPRTAKANYFPATNKTVGNYTVAYPSDQHTTQFIDANGGAAVVTLPNPVGVNADGWSVDIVKFDSTTNTVTINPGANTLNGVAATYVFATQWQTISLTWSTAFNGWLLFDNVVPFATTSSPGRVQLATQAEAGTGTNNSHAVTPLALYQPEATINSGGTVDLSTTTTENLQVLGNTGPIVSFGNAAAGIRRKLRFASNPKITNSGSLILPGGADIQTSAGDCLEAFSLGASSWLVRWYSFASGKTFPSPLPTVQRFLSGSGTYNPTAGVTKIHVRMCAGGGGGGARITNNGADGTDTSFGSWTAIHGSGGAHGNITNPGPGGAGGTGGANGTGNLVVRFPGGAGNGISQANINWLMGGAAGGANPFGGAGASVAQAAGGAGATNTGAGGAGGGVANAQDNPGNGGGAGEYVEFWVNAPGAIGYAVGGGGNGGAAGTTAGGNGAAGIIIIEEWYN